MSRLLTAFAVIAILVATVPAIADWNPEEPFKWVQFPDLEDTGIDVNATYPYLLADDFLCTQSGPITDVHIWGSWYHDYIPWGEWPEGVVFTLSIHADIPESLSSTGYSMPGETLWMHTFQPGEFTARIWMEDINEGWMEPPELYEFPGDHVCWQYNFFIDAADAFHQEGSPDRPVVYWLDVQAVPEDQEAWFGWKTSIDHWNDDAVWGMGSEPYPGPWEELRYPPGHLMYPESIDLAFVITGEPYDELDWGDAPDPTYPTFGASFGANHLIVPGVLMGASVDGEPDGQPHVNALGDDNDGNDDEDGVMFTSPLVPGAMATVDIDLTFCLGGGFLDAWVDFGGDGSWAEAVDQIFASQWLPGGLVTTLNFNVPGIAAPGLTFARFRFSTAGGLTEKGPAPDGEVEDYEVRIGELQTYKWVQYPDLDVTGIDVNDTGPLILADDFLCSEPGRITEVYIWGSWVDDWLPEGDDPYAVEFTLSIHADIPADTASGEYSRPGELLWVRDFMAGEFEAEIWAGDIEEGWLDPPELYTFPADWTCWLYTFYIDPAEAFHQVGMPDEPIVYWLDVQARPLDYTSFFGWKTSLDHWNDDAVYGVGNEPFMGPWFELRYPPEHPFHPESIDLAFAIRCTYGTGAPDEVIPEGFGLNQNVPNPFNPTTTIRYQIPAAGGVVSLEIYNVNGRLVRTLVDGFCEEGEHAVTWDGRDNSGRDLASGVYLYRLSTPTTESSRKMLLLK